MADGCHSDLGLFKKLKTCDARRTGRGDPIHSSSSLLGVGDGFRSAGGKSLPKLRSPSDPASTCSELLGYMSSVESYDSSSESGGGREERVDDGVSWMVCAGDHPGTLKVSSCPFGDGVPICWMGGLVLVEQKCVSFLQQPCGTTASKRSPRFVYGLSFMLPRRSVGERRRLE